MNARIFVTMLQGRAQEWFTSLPELSIPTFDAFVSKFLYQFASKRRSKRSATYLFSIRQMARETLKGFMARFNNEMLDVQDLRIEMVTNILIHGLDKGPFASALARNPPKNMEELSEMAEQYIRKEEIGKARLNDSAKVESGRDGGSK
ncbi:hypothetical protein Salat_2712400 [Sesamum alatum]|uniref:Retrotransposon gag domain-containing protein n=1 Tax=Sesamum alatum TaxID=300844 RepID=A0AAE1XQ77_9LAMI|nr:hypothetical protein Salat_2712400 [Sesamum alatum]